MTEKNGRSGGTFKGNERMEKGSFGVK